MRTFISIQSVLLGLLCLTFFAQKATAARPLEVSKFTKMYGCIPMSRGCPAYMYCFIDVRYPYYGQCTCPGWHSKQQKPPVNNGSELAPPITREDCELSPPIGWYSCLFWIGLFLLGLRFMIGSLMIIVRVVKNDGVKLNSSFVALVAFVLHCVGLILRGFTWSTTRMALDPTGNIRTFSQATYNIMESGFGYFFRYEILCTWVDLFEKSVKMSKNSSRAMAGLRIFTRSLGVITVFILITKELPAFARFEAIYTRFYAAMHGPFLGGVSLFIAPLLVRTLCKDLRDVTHPNWKAAMAVKGAAIGEIFHQGTSPLLTNLLMDNSIYADKGSYGEAILIALFYWVAYSDAEWLAYILFANRKHMTVEDGGSARITNFFGFTTLGLNGSVTSSVVSRVRSSVTSSVVDEPEEKKEIS